MSAQIGKEQHSIHHSGESYQSPTLEETTRNLNTAVGIDAALLTIATLSNLLLMRAVSESNPSNAHYIPLTLINPLILLPLAVLAHNHSLQLKSETGKENPLLLQMLTLQFANLLMIAVQWEHDWPQHEALFAQMSLNVLAIGRFLLEHEEPLRKQLDAHQAAR